MIFYKAVRPDGFDFHSQTVNYAQHLTDATLLPVKTPIGEPQCCTADVYHASTSKADTLIGGNWPCRLFEVEGDSVAEEHNKRGFLTLRVVRELPAWEALGPNGEEVAELIKKAKGMTADQAVRLSAAWDAARDAAGDAAGAAAWAAARDAAGAAAWDAAWDAAEAAAGDAAEAAAWAAAGDAARAAYAIVVRDLITPEHFNTLYGIWASVMDA